ncbi:MAG: autoinducer binding domain-containing protein, partial [Arenibacterium sp.]
MKVITCTDKERSNRVLDLSETLSAAATTDDAWKAYREALTGIGGKSVVYGFFPKNLGRSLASEIVALSSHPEEFNRLYLEEGYIDHDPFAKYVMVEEERSISWADPRAEKFSSRRSEFFTNSLKDFGMEFGITIPLRDGTGAKLGGTGISLDAPSAREAESALAFLGPQFEEAA